MIDTRADRREFLRLVSASLGGLVIGFHVPLSRARAAQSESAAVNSWLHIGVDNRTTIYVAKAEMGQGITTSLPMIIADEADLDWSLVKTEFAPSMAPFVDPQSPFTGGSSSVRGGYEPLRTVGAAAREMLIAAAAAKWKVPAAECSASKGFVIHKEKKIAYGKVALAAGRLSVPQNPKLKEAKDFTLIGKPQKRTDSFLKSTGKAVFGIDTAMPGMLVAAVRTCPVFGGEAKSFKAPPGGALGSAGSGVQIVRVPNGLAAVASGYWKAQKALSTMEIEWDEGKQAKLSSRDLSEQFDEELNARGVSVTAIGDAEKALSGAPKHIAAEYEVPFLAHATMEPMACTAHVTAMGCEIWAPTQSPFFNKVTIAKVLSIDPEKVRVHSTFLGGGFGRKAEQDFIIQAVLCSKAVGKPVKVIWSREEDLQHDFYRPAFKARLRGAIDEKGAPVAWICHSTGDSIMSRWFPENVKDGIDITSVEGAREINYGIAAQKISYSMKHTGIPVGFWRSVGSSQNAFFVESFIDEMAHAAGADPLEFRLRLLEQKPRYKTLLETVAHKAGWGKKLPKGQAMGIALAESFGTIVAEVVEARVSDSGEVRATRVICAVDCGPYVNPSTIEAQMQSGIVYGLSAALWGEISIEKGRVVQNNFHDYPVLHMDQMPQIEVHLVESRAKQGGIGEPGVPPVAPALANAIFAATGHRIRRLPIAKI